MKATNGNLLTAITGIQKIHNRENFTYHERKTEAICKAHIVANKSTLTTLIRNK